MWKLQKLQDLKGQTERHCNTPLSALCTPGTIMEKNENSKRDTLESFLTEGMVLVQLDSRIEEVCVPGHLRDDPTLRLNISGRFGLPLDIDDWGVRATLTFQGDPFECSFPWRAVYILISHVTGEPSLFASDVPPEYVSEALGHLKNSSIAAAKAPDIEPIKEPPRTHLRLVEEGNAAITPQALETGDDDDGPEDDDPAPSPKKPFLSVVK